MTFESSESSTEDKLKNFPKYVDTRSMVRMLGRYELYKKQLHVKGNVVECGVHQGGGLLMWHHLQMMLEPRNIYRAIVGFDTFEGFPEGPDNVNDNPEMLKLLAEKGGAAFSEDYDIQADIEKQLDEFKRFEGGTSTIHSGLVKGDAVKYIPSFLEYNKHFLVSLLYMDFDLYEPTKIALEHFLPRMPKGAILAFDEVNNHEWPGETLAMLECLDIRDAELKSFPWEPCMAYIQL